MISYEICQLAIQEGRMYPSDPTQKFVIRLPNDAKAFVAEQAKRNGSSQNSEIIRAIRDRMDWVSGIGNRLLDQARIPQA